MQSPERRELRIADRLVQRIWRASERGGGLREIVLEQPRFGKHRADRERIFAGQGSGTKDGSDDLRRLGASSTFERSLRTRKKRLDRVRLHEREYTKYPPAACVANQADLGDPVEAVLQSPVIKSASFFTVFTWRSGRWTCITRRPAASSD